MLAKLSAGEGTNTFFCAEIGSARVFRVKKLKL